LTLDREHGIEIELRCVGQPQHDDAGLVRRRNEAAVSAPPRQRTPPQPPIEPAEVAAAVGLQAPAGEVGVDVVGQAAQTAVA